MSDEAKVRTFHLDEPNVEGVLVAPIGTLWKVKLTTGQVVLRRAVNITPLDERAKEMLK